MKSTKYDQAMAKLAEVDGFLMANLIDSESGMSMASSGGGIDVELDSMVGSQVIKSIDSAIDKLNLPETIEDTLISLDHSYHLLRPIRTQKTLFIHLALKRDSANLAMARHSLKKFEAELAALL